MKLLSFILSFFRNPKDPFVLESERILTDAGFRWFVDDHSYPACCEFCSQHKVQVIPYEMRTSPRGHVFKHQAIQSKWGWGCRRCRYLDIGNINSLNYQRLTFDQYCKMFAIPDASTSPYRG